MMQTPDLYSAMIKEQVEEYAPERCKSRTRNVEGAVKKQPQRGLGVAQLEKLRLQEDQQLKHNGFHFPQSPKFPRSVSSYPLVLQKWPPNSIVVICHGDALNGNYSRFCPQSSGSILPPTSAVVIRSPPFVASKQTLVENQVCKTALRRNNYVYPASSTCRNGVELVQKLPSCPPKGILNKTSVLEMKAMEPPVEPVKDSSLLKIRNDSNFSGGSSEELSSFQKYPHNTPCRRVEKTSQLLRKRSWDAMSENPSTDSPSSLSLALSVAGHEDGPRLRDGIQESNSCPMASKNNQLLLQKDLLSLHLASSCFSDNGKAQKTKNTFHDKGNLQLDLSL